MFCFKAKVISGCGRGGQIGFHTANLSITDLPIVYGVYLVKVKLDHKFYQGLLHYGPRKTFGEPLSVEVHLKNFNENIYSRTLLIEVERKIREVKKFADVAALKQQIKKDMQAIGN